MRFCLGFIFLIVSGSAFSQVEKGIGAIDSLAAVARVQFLSCDDLEGRFMGSKGGKISVQYISSEFIRAGYEPIVDTFSFYGIGMQNVYIMIPGESTEIVVVGAHYDHLGVDSQGNVYNGADDNASGVAAVLGIADAIKASGLTPKRSIILALWDGEEKGLYGSRNFVNSFGRIDDVVFYLNFDMIGRNTDESRPNLFLYFYNDTKPEYKRYLDEGIYKFGLSLEPDYSPWDDPTTGSDNASFARAGIPIAWYHTDGHADYHKVTDTHDKINWSKLLDIIKSSYYVSWCVANE